MWLRLFLASLKRQKLLFFLAFLSAVTGTAMVAGLIGVYFEASANVSRELRKYGANIIVQPASSGYLKEEDVYKIKTIFWRHNIVGINPYLYGFAEVKPAGKKVLVAGTWLKKEFLTPEGNKFVAGLLTLNRGARIKGKPFEGDQGELAVIGSSLAFQLGLKPGDKLVLSSRQKEIEVRLVGIIEAGGYEDEQLFLPLKKAQHLFGAEGKVSNILVSAVTVPLDEFGRRDPKTMTRREFEKWYCTAYPPAVAKQIEEVVCGSSARPVWQVVETEGKVLSKFQLVFLTLTLLSLLGSIVAVASTVMAGMMRREDEVALLKALGASKRWIGRLFLSEAFFLGLTGGLSGYLAGILLADSINQLVFGTPFEGKTSLFLLSLVVSLVVNFLGFLFPLKKALSFEPGVVLKG